MWRLMMQPSDGFASGDSSLSFSHHLTIFLLLFQSLRVFLTVPLELICSRQPIIALAGDDVILPCCLEPAADAASWTVEWTKPGLSPKYIHVHEDGRLLYWIQNPSYFSRTRLFVNELMNGNVSMKIFRLKPSDGGKYRCFIPSIQKEAFVQLIVGAVSSPVIEVLSNESRRVELQCESEGWYPEPEVLWLDAEGNLLSAGPTETVRGPDDLYTVSSRVTVEKRHSDNFTCRVQQKDIDQTRETHIHVSDDLFPGPTSASPSPSSSDPVVVGLVVGFVFILAVVLVFVMWKWRRNKLKKKIDSESPDPSAEPLMRRDTNGDMDVDIRIRPASEATGLTEETHQRQTINVQTQGQTEFQERGQQTNQVPSRGETVHGLDQETESEPAEELREASNPTGRGIARQKREDVDMSISPASEATGQTEETQQRQANNVQTKGQMEFQDRGRQTNQVPSGGETVHGLDQETESEPAGEQREASNPTGRDTARQKREDVDMRISPAREATQVSNFESPDPSAKPLMTRDTDGDTVKNVDTRICPSSEATGLTEVTQQRQANNVQTKGQMEFQDGGRQTNQVPSGGETERGLDQGQQVTESEPAEEQREAPDPAGRDTARQKREDVDMRISPASEATQVSNSESPDPSAEHLTRRDTNRDTVEKMDMKICPSSEATVQTEETDQRQTNNVQIQERDTQQEQPIEERKTDNDLQTEEEEKSESAETETVNDVDTEKDKLQRKLQAKERDMKNLEKSISRLMGNKKEQEKKIKELRLQLEEVERQREETERKMESVNREEDMMKTQREAAEEEEDEAVKRLLDSRKDLEGKKEELQKQLEKTEKAEERNKKDVIYMTERKIKATKEKEEIIKKIEEMEKQRRRREAAKDEGQSDSDEDL